MLKAIIFDLDQTLFDWRGRNEDWETHQRKHLDKVFRFVDEHVQTMPTDFEDFFETTVSNVIAHWRHAKQSLQAPHLGKILVASLIECGVAADKINMDDILAAYQHQLIDGVILYPEVIEVLQFLQQHDIRMGIATNAFQPMLLRDAELQTLGIVDYFDARLSAADVGYLKPHPRIFESVLTMLEATPQETIFIGDNLHADIGGAQALGMRAILRVHEGELPYENEPPEVPTTPDAEILSLTELPPILDAWFGTWRKG